MTTKLSTQTSANDIFCQNLKTYLSTIINKYPKNKQNHRQQIETLYHSVTGEKFSKLLEESFHGLVNLRPKVEELLLHEYITGNKMKVYATL